MDILTSKSYKSYSRLSRYSNFETYYNKLDDKFMYGTTAYLSNNTPYSVHQVQYNETYDSIALDYYNNPTYYWVICSFNRIQDPFKMPEEGSFLKIPSLSKISFEE